MAASPAGDLPRAVLFACNHNAIRSPMAEAFLKHLHGGRIYVDSVGVRAGELDPFAVTVMEELGLSIADHLPKSFDELEDTNFDLVVTLTPEAQHRAVELTRTNALELEYWPTFDPTAVHGARAQRLDAYRQLRDQLFDAVKARFPHPRVAQG